MKEESISLGDLFGILKRSRAMIAIVAIVMALIAFTVSTYVIEPTYEASTQVLVTPKQTENNVIDNAQVQSSVTLVNTYRVIIESPAILEEVQNNVPGAPEHIEKLITVDSEQNSQVINIKVQEKDPVLATNIANEIARVFSTQVPVLMSVDNITILSEAVVPESPVKPSVMLNTAIAFVLGVVVGIAIVFLRIVFDRRIKTEQDVMNILGLPVLGVIPAIEKAAETKVGILEKQGA